MMARRVDIHRYDDWQERFRPYFKAQGAARYLQRRSTPRPNALFPRGLERDSNGQLRFHGSLDKEVLALTEELADRATALFPADKRKSGLAGKNGVPGDFYALRNVSGIGADPRPIPLMDNDQFVESQGCPSTCSAEDLPYFKEVIRLMFEAARPCDLYIRRDASTSFPFFSRDVGYKKAVALHALKHVDEFLDLACGPPSGMLDWLERFHAVYMYAIYKREQPDKVTLDQGVWKSKDRVAPTEMEAREGRFDGTTIANKLVHDPLTGLLVPGHFAMRQRDVFGMCGVVNYVLTAIFSCYREVYLDRFSHIFKCRGDADKQAFLDKYTDVIGSDVKTMDKLIPRWYLDLFCEELAKYMDERVAILLRRSLAATFVSPNPWRETPEDYNPVFGPAPHEAVADNCPGLTSGVAPNPDIGKAWMCGNYALVSRDAGVISSPAEIEALWSGTHPTTGLQDSSDDAAFGTNDKVVAHRLQGMKSPYAILEPETPVVYLGSVYSESAYGPLSAPNPVTYLLGYYAREDNIANKKPEHYGNGVKAREMVYSTMPIYSELKELNRELMFKHLGHCPLDLADPLASWLTLDPIDAVLVNNPAALFYKIRPSDVKDPAVLDSIVAKVPYAEYSDSIKHLFKVPI